jgi:hypothetical protein
MESVEVKILGVKQLCSMHLHTKFQSSIFSYWGEIKMESCQNVSALPADKPYSSIIRNVQFFTYEFYTLRLNAPFENKN